MKILVLGNGGREHAIVWKLQQSPSVTEVWCAPGNGGISQDADCFPLDLANPQAAVDLAAHLQADLTVVGPELPLVRGISDVFGHHGLAILGPTSASAQLEASKIFAKQFLEHHSIPTAPIIGICHSSASASQALRSVADWPAVIKADGLCAGKGVLVASNRDEAIDFVRRAMELREFGEAGQRLLIEQGLRGEELSYIILTDGEHFIRLAPARDHKRAYDNDAGPNTGGMGAYSSDDLLPPVLEQTIVDSIVLPTLQGLRANGLRYRGFLYFGLMLTCEGPKVLEYNCRLGDPETQAVLLRADFDFADACFQAAAGSLAGFRTGWAPQASACVVLASEGYPQRPITGREIADLSALSAKSDSVVFHAGTRREDHKFYSTAGRVLAVAANGTDLDQALGIIYERMNSIHLDGGFYRRDIGAGARSRHAFSNAPVK